MMKEIFTYENPDLDGYACGIALEEFLNSLGEDAIFVLSGTPQLEVDIVTELLGASHTPKILQSEESTTYKILVDASDRNGISKCIDPLTVREVIDHRRYFNKEDFPNAQFYVEPVGAAATLIAEMFINAGRVPSFFSASLLYHAISSNTINFKAQVTTDRDKLAAKYLAGVIGDAARWTGEIFTRKSEGTRPSLQDYLSFFFGSYDFSGKKLGIVQLEIVAALDFLVDNRQENASILKQITSLKGLSSCIITSIDLVKGINYVQGIDPDLIRSLAQILGGVMIDSSMFAVDPLLMRKEIIPKLKNGDLCLP